MCPAGGRHKVGRADVGIGPYGCVTRSAVGRATARVAPTQKSLPCLKGGRPTESWWRDTCGENGCAFAVSSCGGESPSHGFAVTAPFRQGGRGDGGADCHNQFANWSRNDRATISAADDWRRDEGTPPYGGGYKRCSKTGRRGNRRSAAGGRRSEAVSRKCPDWWTRQWPGIGWHDGGQPPAPTKFCVSLFFLAKIF